MSRQSKMRNKRAARLAAKQASAKPKLTAEQKELRREQARVLFEAKMAEKARRLQEEKDRKERALRLEEKKKERKRAQKERTQRTRSRTSSLTSGIQRHDKAMEDRFLSRAGRVKVSPHGTVHQLGHATVINRGAVHIKTYPAGAQVKFLGDGKHAVVIISPNLPVRMLDLETGLDREIDPSPVPMTGPTPTSTLGA